MAGRAGEAYRGEARVTRKANTLKGGTRLPGAEGNASWRKHLTPKILEKLKQARAARREGRAE